MDANRELVEKHGICVVHCLPVVEHPWWGYADGHHRRDWEFGSEEEAYRVTAEFTRARLEEVRQVERDLEWVTDARVVANVEKYDMGAKRRTIERLQAILAEKKTGLNQ